MAKISLEELKRKGTKKRASFMRCVEFSIKPNKTYTEKDINEGLKIRNQEEMKKVTRALNNLVRHKRIERLYLNNKPFYFIGDMCLNIDD